MPRFRKQLHIASRFPAWLLLLHSSPIAAQQPQLPTAATNAIVTADEVAVLAEMNAESEKVSSLKKGTSLYVDLRMDQGRQLWCGVRATPQTPRIGFVDCRLLQRVGGPPAISASRGSSGSANSISGPLAEIPVARASAPSSKEYESIKARVIQDDVLDSGYIATLDAQASGGNAATVTRAALAHLAAGEFEFAHHDPDKALEHFEAMGRFAGTQRNLQLASLTDRAFALLAKSEYASALDVIAQARKLAPQSAELAGLSGWAHYRLNQMDTAVADLQTAQRLRPTAGVAALLDRATRDREAEGDFSEGESRHFVLRYHEGATRHLASELIQLLEEHYKSLESELHFAPPEPITVIVYTREKFRDVTGAPDWAGALNDGRIRVAVQGLETVPDALSRSLKHELTHSFLYQKTRGHCPTWLQEGVAQWMAGRRVGGDAAQLLAVFQSGNGKSLRSLEGNWMTYSRDDAWFAYWWSLATIEGIEADSGSDGLERLLDAERTESSADAALLQGLRTHSSSLDEATVAYLRRTYLQ